MTDPSPQQEFQQRPQYHQINSLLDQYKRVIQQKFQANESLLLEELQQKTLQLKKDIAIYKAKISPESMEKLITDKRHQKQAERLELEVHWRNLTEKYKKLQEEQKKINEENRQNQFDIQNLQRKILQLQQANKNMEDRLHKLKKQAEDQPFMTQIKTQYISPYKYTHKTINEELELKGKLKAMKSTVNFRLKVQGNKKKYKTLVLPQTGQENQQPSTNQLPNTSNNQIPTKLPSFAEQLQVKKTEFLRKNECKFSPMDINNMYSYQEQSKQCEKSGKFPNTKTEKWAELTYYLNKPQVRDKIFDLIRKEALNL